MVRGSAAKKGEVGGVPRFYCDRWSGLSIWAHALGRFLHFQGGWLVTEDPAEVAFIRATDYFQRLS